MFVTGEHADGLNGFLLTRRLDEHWGAAWRRNEGGIKTAHGRRKKVVQLFTRIIEVKTQWAPLHVVTFIVEHYPQYKAKPNMFPRFLAENGNSGLAELLRHAGVEL